jgi:hypothetical protein
MAAPGKLLPIFYKGSIIHIGKDPVELDPKQMKFESMAQLTNALKDGDVLEVKD